MIYLAARLANDVSLHPDMPKPKTKIAKKPAPTAPTATTATTATTNARSQLQVQIVLETPDLRPPLKRWLTGEVKRIAALADVTQGSVTLVIVDDQRMTEMHGQYKDDLTTTDVLTFDLRESPDEPIEGDLILCIDEAARQAKRRQHDTRTELLLYAVHGLLHLMGYDDLRAADYRKMHAKEDELFQLAGYGNVFKNKK